MRRGLVFAVALATLASGCGNDGNTTAGSTVQAPSQQAPSQQAPSGQVANGEDVTITIWHNRAQYVPEDAYQALMEKHPNITIVYDVVPWEEQLSAYVRNFAVGNAPDIFQLEHGVVPQLAEQKMVRDMSEIRDRWQSEDPADFEDFIPATWSALTWDGGMYGMALFPFTRQYNYRVDILKEFGLDPPKNWGDVLEIARATRSDDLLGYAIEGSRLAAPEKTINMYQAMGGQSPGGVIQLDSEAGIYLLDFIQTLSREKLIHPDTLSWDHSDMRTSFILGDTAQNYMGSHMYPKTQENFAYGTEWDFVPMLPREGAEDQAAYGANIFGYLLSSQSEAPMDALYEVYRYLAAPDRLESIARDYAPITRDSIYRKDYFRANLPWWEKMVDARGKMVAFPANPQMPAMYQIIHDARQAAISDPDRDTAELAAEFQQKINALFK